MSKNLYITEDDPEINVLHMLNEYADRNTAFKNEFLDSIDRVFEKNRKISWSQYQVLLKIYKEIDAQQDLTST